MTTLPNSTIAIASCERAMPLTNLYFQYRHPSENLYYLANISHISKNPSNDSLTNAIPQQF